jgi:hypothetical protein
MKTLTKTELKVVEKIALSAYAEHLYQGLNKGSYTLGEVIRYWRYAKEDVGAQTAGQLYGTDPNIWDLLQRYDANVSQLEDAIQYSLEDERIRTYALSEHRDKDDRIEVSAALLPAAFELAAFPGVPMRVSRGYSYVDDSQRVQLVIERLDTYQHFGKGTLGEIKAQIAKEVRA